MPDPFRWRMRVRFSDTDASGRIHYLAMFRYMEAAEDEFLRSLGVAYAEIEAAQGVSFPRVHVEAQFVSALRYDEVLDIEVSVERVGETAFTLYFDASASGTAVARGRMTVVCISVATERPVSLPAVLADALLAEMDVERRSRAARA
jgi:YbgC/YbaW family acyl-CoA thioester hydrolase